MKLEFDRSSFPKDFQFGVSTSAYQIEGHRFGAAGPTHWDTFAAIPGNVVRCENGDIACDHYHRWGEDLDLTAAAGFDVYRFSTSWARILPQGLGGVNSEGLDFYDRLVDGMLERGLKPALTLYHWELPVALAQKGGWIHGDMPHWFAEYTDTVIRRLGDRVWSVAPINEPYCVGWLSHFLGHHAPGLRDIRATARAMHHILTSHGTAIEVMRAHGQKNLGAVCNFEFSQAADDSAPAQAAADLHDSYYNRFFVEALFKGRYPDLALEGLAPHLPEGWQDDFGLIAQPLDWLGLNYYTRHLIAPSDGAWGTHETAHPRLATTQMGWEIYPEGLGHFLRRIRDEYTHDLPLYITENGMAHADTIDAQGRCEDHARIEYFNAHLAEVAHAAQEGIPVRGYFAWSLLDNFEWSLGYEKRFGLVHVDFDSLKRTPKLSYEAFKAALSS